MNPTATAARDVSREPVQGVESRTTGRGATAKERHGGCTERTIQGTIQTRKTRGDMTERDMTDREGAERWEDTEPSEGRGEAGRRRRARSVGLVACARRE